MSFEYIEEIPQNNYTLTGAVDENYPLFNIDIIYRKSDKVIYNNKIYEARATLPLPTYYVYNQEEDELYIPREEIYVDEVIISSSDPQYEKYVYIDDTSYLYKFIGLSISQAPANIDFTDTNLWENLGKQLNGYTTQPNYPDTYVLGWKDLGYVNTQKAFDNSTPTQTIATGETMTYVFNTGKVDRLALFELDASAITIKVHLTANPEDETNTKTDTYDLYTREGTTFYEILTAEIKREDVGYFELPTASVQQITITITNQSSTAKLGDITLGQARSLGVTLDNVNFDIKDYSTYSSDSEATDRYTEGKYRKISDFTVSFPTKEMKSIEQQLNSQRGKVTVYNINTKSDERFFKFKGFMRSRPINYISNNTKSKINIKVEGRVR